MEKLAVEMLPDAKRETATDYSRNPIESAVDFTGIMNGTGLNHKVFVYQNKSFHVSFNGVIYNSAELRRYFLEQGFDFEAQSDHEVILALYLLKGERCVQSLRGMFAFAIWDEQNDILFVARDPFGIKSFYYTESEEGLFFATDARDLANGESDQHVYQEALQHYLTYQYVPEPYTLAKEIRKLKPGHYLTKKPGEDVNIQIYYRKEFIRSKGDLDYYIDQTREALEDSVAHHMKAGAPVGAFLSGGIDSTAIVALAKQYQKDIKTFTVGFENQGYNETDIAKETAGQLGVENIRRLITPKEFVNELPEIISHMDSPVADPAAIPLYFAAKEAREHVGVVLSGEGADELFGGYNIYREPLALKGFDFIPGFLKKILKQLALLLPEGVKGRSYMLRGTTPLSERYVGNAHIFSEEEKRELLTHYETGVSFAKLTKPLFQGAISYDDSLKMQYIDLHTWLPGDILAKATSMTAAHALELRTPFLDKGVFDVAREIPTQHKIAHKTTKYVLREAVKDIVPENVLYRKKLGFPVPIRHWLRNELYDWACDMIEKSPTEHLIKKDVIRSLLDEHALHKKDNSRKIWVVLVFMQWYAKQKMGIHERENTVG